MSKNNYKILRCQHENDIHEHVCGCLCICDLVFFFWGNRSSNEGPSSNQNTQKPLWLQPACHHSTCIPAAYAYMSMLVNEHMQSTYMYTVFFKPIPPQCGQQNSLMFYSTLIRSSNMTPKTSISPVTLTCQKIKLTLVLSLVITRLEFMFIDKAYIISISIVLKQFYRECLIL